MEGIIKKTFPQMMENGPGKLIQPAGNLGVLVIEFNSNTKTTVFVTEGTRVKKFSRYFKKLIKALFFAVSKKQISKLEKDGQLEIKDYQFRYQVDNFLGAEVLTIIKKNGKNNR